MMLGSLEPLEWAAISLAIVLVTGVVYWRIWMERVPPESQEHLKAAP